MIKIIILAFGWIARAGGGSGDYQSRHAFRERRFPDPEGWI
jgi:hypothetical protein